MFQCWLYKLDVDRLEKRSLANDELSLDAFVLSLPEGVYTTMRTVGKIRIFQFRYHLNRLIESYSLSKGIFPFDINKIRQPLFVIINEFLAKELRIRIHIPLNSPETVYFLLEELTTPQKSDFEQGVSVNTNQLSRNNPKAKLTSFIRKSEKIKKYCKEHFLEESLLINSENQLLEGLSSNFFAVLDNTIYTADKEVLSGATRDIILDEARNANLELNYCPITYDQINDIDEAFISSTSRGLLPVIKIDNFKIANGKPGKISKLLMGRLNERMLFESENII